MGCVCAKGIPKAERDEKIRHSTKRLVGPSKKDEDVVIGDNAGNDVTTRLILHFPADETAVSSPVSPDEREKKDVIAVKPRLLGETPVDVRANGGQPQPLTLSKMTTSPSHRTEAGPVLTGWPPWLSAVAGEAISGWAPRKAESFEKLEKIGQGTYSSVYKTRDLETGKIVALKKVRFTRMDPESVRFMAREIIILRKLDHPNVMKLEGLITSKVSGSLYLVFEYMEHDLAGLAASPGTKFTEAQIKCFIQQLLCGLEYCHRHGVLHRDIKGANLLIDNNGILKIADFGLATLFNSNQKQPMTSRVVTLWYRPPELLLGSTNYGPAVDLWSAGCILAELFSGKPIMPGRTEVEQLHKIFKLCGSPSEEFWKKSKLPHATIFKPQRPYRCCISETFKDLPSSALALVEVLLAIEPENRGLASSALHSELFTTHPLPCDPASLPKCPPSKEFDAKIRNEEAKKRRAANNGRTQESKRRVSGESEAVAAPNANAELPASIQRHGQSNAKCRSEVLVVAAHAGADLPESFKGTSHSVLSHSSRSVRYNEVGSSRQKNATIINMEEDPTGSRGLLNSSGNDPEIGAQKSFSGQRAAQFSRLSSSGVQGNSRFDSNAANSHWFGDRFSGKYNRLDDADLLDRPKSSQRKGDQPSRKESMMGSAVTNRFHYSGPLLAPDRNVEEMLKEHEKQIQHAVRKARQDNLNSKKIHNDTGLAGSLLHYRRNGN